MGATRHNEPTRSNRRYTAVHNVLGRRTAAVPVTIASSLPRGRRFGRCQTRRLRAYFGCGPPLLRSLRVRRFVSVALRTVVCARNSAVDAVSEIARLHGKIRDDVILMTDGSRATCGPSAMQSIESENATVKMLQSVALPSIPEADAPISERVMMVRDTGFEPVTPTVSR